MTTLYEEIKPIVDILPIAKARALSGTEKVRVKIPVSDYINLQLNPLQTAF